MTEPSPPTLALVILAVADVPWAVRFYRTAFGWRLQVETPVYAEFAIPAGPRLGLYERRSFGVNTRRTPLAVPVGAVTGTELYLATDDLPAAIERLAAAGARPLSDLALREWGDEAAYFADPDGNVLVVARPYR